MEYFIKASAVLCIFYVCYKWFLEKETFFNANRWFLLSGLVMASLLPFMVIPVYVEYMPMAFSENVLMVETNPQNTSNLFNISTIITWLYVMGLAFFLGKLIVELTSLFSLIRTHKQKKENGFTFVETTNNMAPFSFFKWIVFNPNQFREEELSHIISHEKAHAKEYHSIDVLLAQISCVVFWFNPICWLYKKEIQQNQEFIADFKAQKQSQCKKSYQRLLLKASITNHPLVVTNNFYNSLIKKRILMLHKSKSNRSNTWKLGIVLPLLALFLMSFNTKKVFVNDTQNHTLNTLDYTTKPTQEVVVITKDFTDSDLEEIKNQLSKKGLVLKFKGVKRNTSGEIIAIKIDVKSNNSSAKYNLNGEKAIAPIQISFEKNGDHIAIGNASSNSKEQKMVFISKDGEITEIDTEKGSENVFVYRTKDGLEKEVELDVERDGNVMFISDDTKVKTLKKGNRTIEIVTLSDDEDVIELETDGSLTNKTIWVTKEDSEVNWTSDENGNKERTYKVKITSSDEDVDNLKITSDDLSANQKVKVLKLKEKEGFFISSNNGTPLFILDGKEITKDEMEKIDPNIIAHVNVLKGDKAIEVYGEKAKDGVVEITTKK